MNDAVNTTPPEAAIRPIADTRSMWIWVIPALAGVFVVALLLTYVVKRGTVITVQFAHGHGIRTNDPLRLRGIDIGAVESVRLTENRAGVLLRVRLKPEARGVARAGSRFWIERPRVGLTGVGGLDTITGARYLAVLPGEGERTGFFEGLDDPPVVEALEPAGLEISLVADRRQSLRPGAPVTYRQVRIGTVLSVGLASDAASVRVRCYIEPAYTAVVRTDSVFWNTSGAEMSLGLGGLRLEVESLRELLDGGVSLATPDPPGEPVRNGHRFLLRARPEKDWLQWRPALTVGRQWLPPQARTPDMVRISTTFTEGRFFKSRRTRRGWALPVSGGLLLPGSLLDVNGKEDEAVLEIAGRKHTLTEIERSSTQGVSRVAVTVPNVAPWTAGATRRMERAEDCLVLTDPQTPPRPIASDRLLVEREGYWRVDRAMTFAQDLSGGAVMARSDGALVGFLEVQGGTARVLPPAFGIAESD